MKLINIFLCIALSFLISCGGGSSSSSTAIEGKDFSGTYRYIGVECYDSNISNLTAVATLSNTSTDLTKIVSGNSLTSSYLSNTCSSTITNNIVFTETSSNNGVSVGQVVITTKTVSISGGATCNVGWSLELQGGSPAISPSIISDTITSSTSETETRVYLKNSTGIAIVSPHQVSSSPTDICFEIFQKI